VGSYWALSAGKDGELWSTFWLERRIAIGWPAIGDLRRFASREELAKEYEAVWPGSQPGQKRNNVGQLWRFYKEIQVDDTVFVRSHGMLIGIARVTGEYEFLQNSNLLREKFHSNFFDDDYPHVRRVNWISLSGAMKQPLTVTKVTEMAGQSTEDED